MNSQSSNIEGEYKTLLLIWFVLLLSQFLLLGLIYISVDEVFPLAFSGPMLGDNTVLVILSALLGLEAVFFSFYRRSKLLKQSVAEQKVEVVQHAQIVGAASAASVTLWGVFLAFAFHYRHFFVWIVVGISATILHFPQRRHLRNALAGKS